MSDDGSDMASWNVPADLRLAFVEVATAAGCDRERLVRRALTQYLEGEGADILAAAKGDAEFAQGDSSDFEEVLSEMEAIVRGRAA
jgi:predicted transcriptional regulator